MENEFDTRYSKYNYLQIMKKILFAISAALVVFAGCKKNDIDINSGVGKVSFTLTSDGSAYVTKALPEADVNTFKISLKSSDGSYSQEWASYSEFPSVLELVSGTYTVTASSPSAEPVAWDQPVYGGSKEFSVMVGRVSSVELTCSITNMMVTMNATDDFLNELTSFEVTVKSNDGTLVWTREEVTAGKAGFFAVSPLEIWVKGTRHSGEAAKQQYLKIDDVAAKDHHIINLDAKVTGDVNGIQLVIDNTVNDREQDINVPGFEEIPVEGGDQGGEEGGNEENPAPSTAPTMVWAENPDFAQTPLASEMSVNIQILAPEKIKEFIVRVESPTAGFMGAVAAMVSPENNHSSEGYVDLDLINDAVAVENLGMLLPTGDALKGQPQVDFPLSELVPMIAGFSPEQGTVHSFTLNVTDEKDQMLSQKLSFVKE